MRDFPLSSPVNWLYNGDRCFDSGVSRVKQAELDEWAKELAPELGESPARTRELVQAVYDGLARYNALESFPAETIRTTIRCHLKAFWPRFRTASGPGGRSISR
ncbi:hypothetical protein CVV65_16125 [Kyrpidia spormannii]|uniref:Uncharacterized protein n=1 Tax=Kyrpidia spormannii TaxID=2055160 RepID=A0A2K8NAA1_9BACL|nr:hypothetical protein CVV65_16125 [Kyrpidia spormannii]